MAPVTVRRAMTADGEALIRLIRGLADYEHLTGPDAAAAERIVADLDRRYTAWLAETNGRAIGYAITFETYSTFRGLPKLYLEDIFVEPGARSTGAGFALFCIVVEEAVSRGCDALEWEALDWNQLALDFYARVGGEHSKEWLPYRLGREGMERLLES